MTIQLKHIFACLILFVGMNVSATTLTEEADSAYMNDEYGKALDTYLKIVDKEGTSSNLYYNIGNCYYRLNKLGMAILYYERALRLDPSNDDARTNLEFVNTKVTDELGDKGMFISNTVNGFAQRFPANDWAGVALGSFVLLLGAIALYFFSGSIALRKIGFFGAIVLLLVCIFTNICAYISTRYSTANDEAVIVEPSTLLSTSPRTPKDRSEEAILLHEGTKVTILDSVSTRQDSIVVKWYDVKVDNHNRAWIKGADIERI